MIFVSDRILSSGYGPTAMVTVLLCLPPELTTSEMASPMLAPPGTMASI